LNINDQQERKKREKKTECGGQNGEAIRGMGMQTGDLGTSQNLCPKRGGKGQAKKNATQTNHGEKQTPSTGFAPSKKKCRQQGKRKKKK